MFTHELFEFLGVETLESIILDLADTADERLRDVMLEAGDALERRTTNAAKPGEVPGDDHVKGELLTI